VIEKPSENPANKEMLKKQP